MKSSYISLLLAIALPLSLLTACNSKSHEENAPASVQKADKGSAKSKKKKMKKDGSKKEKKPKDITASPPPATPAP